MCVWAEPLPPPGGLLASPHLELLTPATGELWPPADRLRREKQLGRGFPACHPGWRPHESLAKERAARKPGSDLSAAVS